MKCVMCGNEITRADRSKYCSVDCYTKSITVRKKITAMFKRCAKKYNFDIKNEQKILNAKILLFKDSDVKRCPCDADNPERFCGSALCIHDVVEYGHCHCNLFHKKLLQKMINKL